MQEKDTLIFRKNEVLSYFAEKLAKSSQLVEDLQLSWAANAEPTTFYLSVKSMKCKHAPYLTDVDVSEPGSE
jgi:hypothetical protein